ncbi:MAG: riboflavin synthase [Alphaproteobacteria bacterium]
MFTGLITDVGQVRAIRTGDGGQDTRIEIATAYDLEAVPLGASIACSGVCLTAVDKGRTDDRRWWFAVDVSAETLAVTALARWAPGRPVNLERSLRVGDELGGHIVQGHVDGVATLSRIAPEGGSHRLWIEIARDLAPFIAPKGSIAVDGVSLTVNEATADGFGVNIIPHTWTHTAFDRAREGDLVNIEIDVLARYVARLREVS